MPLSAGKVRLESDLAAMFKRIDPKNPKTADQAAKELADIVHAYVSSATVTGTIAGTAAVSTAPGAAPLTGTCAGSLI